VTISKSHLREIYDISEMSYLDGDGAAPIYSYQASLIRKHQLTGIVDIGCRTGTINNYLKDYTYNYYGIDTSPGPIELAKKLYPSKKFDVRSWENLYTPNFKVDVVLFSSVLIYVDDPKKLFEDICYFYQPKRAIIHEVSDDNIEDFEYTNLQYFTDKYTHIIHHLSLDIPCKKRTILDVQYS